MVDPNKLMAQQVARAACDFQRQRTGYAPDSVIVIVGGDTLAVKLPTALSRSEKARAQTTAGAAEVQEFHRRSFSNSSEPLRQSIKQITGVEIREVTAEVATNTDIAVLGLTSGAAVEVFLITNRAWVHPCNGIRHGGHQESLDGPRRHRLSDSSRTPDGQSLPIM
jgi:uncharacterized protein YbcI